MQSDRSGNAWRWLAIALFGVAWGANQFAPMLRVYADVVGLSEPTVSATFGVYAVGIAPGILLGGPLSDRVGRPAIVFPATVISLLATGVLLGAQTAAPLYVARLLAGLASGLAFSAGSAWLLALSADAGPGVGGVRNTVALTCGFALGPLATGSIVGWVEAPLITPYLPHLLLMSAGIGLLLWVPRHDAAARGQHTGVPLTDVFRPQLPAGLAWVAPFSFGTAVMAFAVLPAFGAPRTPFGAGLVTALTLGTGVAVQPLARRIGVRDPARLARIGLATAAAAFGVGALYTSTASEPLLVVACVAAGFAYGFNFLYGFLVMGPSARGVQVAQLYVAAYIGFGFSPGIVSASELVPIHWVLLGFGAFAAALGLAHRDNQRG
ncbi:MAG: MFS transporter [Myxococcales bacterium]|nr:MFS transporter [Myxococcales bacterium]